MSGAINDAHLEPCHCFCSSLFNNCDCTKFSSKTVVDELDKKIRDRDKLYKKILKYLSNNQLLDSFCPPLNDNDKRHLEKIKSGYQSGSYDVAYIRSLGSLLFSGITDELNKIQQPLIDSHQDCALVAQIEAIGIHFPDSQIITDYFHWVYKRNVGYFISTDGMILQKNIRNEIMGIFIYEKYMDPSRKGFHHVNQHHMLR